MGTLATRAEELYGVAAAAITAIAILESGYGWTRLAQNTNNLLGWKYFADASAAERDFWVLESPERGTRDRFIVFRHRAEAVDFVADQLASSDNYRADTERYRRDRASGLSVVEAVNRWVDGIADPYSSEPEAWRSAVRRVINDTYELAEGSSERNLYSLSSRSDREGREQEGPQQSLGRDRRPAEMRIARFEVARQPAPRLIVRISRSGRSSGTLASTSA